MCVRCSTIDTNTSAVVSELAATLSAISALRRRDAFARDIKTTQVLHNHSGKPEITVVNIQKFQDDPDVPDIRKSLSEDSLSKKTPGNRVLV